MSKGEKEALPNSSIGEFINSHHSLTFINHVDKIKNLSDPVLLYNHYFAFLIEDDFYSHKAKAIDTKRYKYMQGLFKADSGQIILTKKFDPNWIKWKAFTCLATPIIVSVDEPTHLMLRLKKKTKTYIVKKNP